MCIISVIIPVKNGEATLEKCLAGIYSQSIADQVEVIILDSGSTDASVTICSKFPVRIIPVEPSTFNHGLTRNFGAAVSNGDYLYFTVQDARIAEKDMLHNMRAHFSDTAVQAVVGMQAIPSDPDKNPAVWFNRISEPVVEIRHFPENTFLKLGPNEQYVLSNWDNVNAMYRRSAIEQVPFRNTSFSEDWIWANDALCLGMKIIRDPSLVVYHYHHQNFSYTLKEQYILHYNHWKFFRRKPDRPMLFKPVLNAIYRILNKHDIAFKAKIQWILHNVEINVSKLVAFLIFRIGYSLKKQEGLDYLYRRLISENIPQGRLKEYKVAQKVL